eukprot:jgi/Mesvir1/10325/Mv26302-RA.2
MSVSAAHQRGSWDAPRGHRSSKPSRRGRQHSVEASQPVRETDSAADACTRADVGKETWGGSTTVLTEWPEGQPRVMAGRRGVVNGAVGGGSREGGLQPPPRRQWHHLWPAEARHRVAEDERVLLPSENGYDGHIAEDNDEDQELYADWGMGSEDGGAEAGGQNGWGPAGGRVGDVCAVLDELATRGQLDDAVAMFGELLGTGEARAPGWILGASLMRTLRMADRVDLMDVAFAAMQADDAAWQKGVRIAPSGSSLLGRAVDVVDNCLVVEHEALITQPGWRQGVDGRGSGSGMPALAPTNGAHLDDASVTAQGQWLETGGGHGMSDAARMAQDSAMARRGVYEAMILAHRKQQDWARMLALFDEFAAMGAPLTMPLCAAAIQACFLVVVASEGKHGKTGSGCDKPRERASRTPLRVRESPAQRRLRQAVSLFEHAARLGWLMRASTYSQVLQCYLQLRMPHRVVEVYRRMCVAGVKPKYAPSYKAILTACGQLGLWEELLAVVTAMGKDGFNQSAKLYTSAISMLAKGGKWQEAARVFELMRSARVSPDLVAYSALISAYASGQQWEAAIATLAQMRAKGVLPDVTAYTATITACTKAGRPDDALSLLRAMLRSGVAPNSFTASALLKGLERAGRSDDAIRLFEEMLALGVTPDLFTHTIYIKVLGNEGRWQDAVVAFDRVAAAAATSGRREEAPDRRCVGALLHALGIGRQVSRALALFGGMRQAYGITPDTQLYNMLLAAVKRSGDLQDVLDVFDAMQRPGEAFAVVAGRDKAAREKAGLETESDSASVGRMEAAGAVEVCWSAAGAQKGDHGDYGARGGQGQRRQHPPTLNPHPPDTVTYNTLMSVFEQARQWDRVLATYEVMKGGGPTCAPDDSTHHVLRRVMDKLSSQPITQKES